MYTLYDTRKVHPLERYEYARAGAGAEVAPVAIHGRSPGRLLAAMSVARVGDFEIEAVTWGTDSEIVARRTERLIRACDPDCYRIFLSVNGRARMEQAGNQVCFHDRDIALYDLSQPWLTTHPTGPAMRAVMLTFPRALVPIPPATVRPLLGTAIPRRMPGRTLIAQFLIELTDNATAADPADDPGLAEVMHECTVGLIRQRLGQPNGITPRTRARPGPDRLRREHLAALPSQDIPGRTAHPDAAAQAASPGTMPPQPARSSNGRDTYHGHHFQVRLPSPRPVRPRLQA